MCIRDRNKYVELHGRTVLLTDLNSYVLDKIVIIDDEDDLLRCV